MLGFLFFCWLWISFAPTFLVLLGRLHNGSGEQVGEEGVGIMPLPRGQQLLSSGRAGGREGGFLMP